MLRYFLARWIAKSKSIINLPFNSTMLHLENTLIYRSRIDFVSTISQYSICSLGLEDVCAKVFERSGSITFMTLFCKSYANTCSQFYFLQQRVKYCLLLSHLLLSFCNKRLTAKLAFFKYSWIFKTIIVGCKLQLEE